MIAQGFQREVGDLIRFHAKVTAIHQNERGVTVHYATGADRREAHADWCVCTIPLSILRQLDLTVTRQWRQRTNPYCAQLDVKEHCFQCGPRRRAAIICCPN